MKGLKRFGVKGKLSPRFIGPFKILSQNRSTAFELELPEKLKLIHNVFHVSQLRKCLKVPDEPVSHEELELQADMTYVEKPAKILVKLVHPVLSNTSGVVTHERHYVSTLISPVILIQRLYFYFGSGF